jgi:RimJ/RimL family protein N-acetyltransferase
MDYSENSWAEGTRYDFAIIDATDGTLLGGCGLSNISRTHRLANLFYWVRSSCTGRGAATAAARLLARFGFEHAGLLRVEIVVAVGNGASLHVAEKSGAQHEGLLRNRLQMHGKQYDAHMFSLIPSDLE